MKRQVPTNVLTACLLVIAAVSCAYAGQSATVNAKVPFAFTVGESSLPAGDYTFYEGASGVIKIQSADRIECVYWAHPGTPARNDGAVKLIFHRYGAQYFLSEVFNGMGDSSLKFVVSKLEKDHIGAASHAVAEDTRPRDVVIYGTR